MKFSESRDIINIWGVFVGLESEDGDMYQIGEFVIYGIHGVCRVMGTEKQLVNRKPENEQRKPCDAVGRFVALVLRKLGRYP